MKKPLLIRIMENDTLLAAICTGIILGLAILFLWMLSAAVTPVQSQDTIPPFPEPEYIDGQWFLERATVPAIEYDTQKVVLLCVITQQGHIGARRGYRLRPARWYLEQENDQYYNELWEPIYFVLSQVAFDWKN